MISEYYLNYYPSIVSNVYAPNRGKLKFLINRKFKYPALTWATNYLSPVPDSFRLWYVPTLPAVITTPQLLPNNLWLQCRREGTISRSILRRAARK
jgi:hypothetical protein